MDNNNLNIINQYLINNSDYITQKDLLSKLIKTTHEKTVMARMLSGFQVGAILKFIVQMHNPQNILEIGCFTGFSSICMAEGFTTKSQQITTTEINPGFAAIAQQHFDQCLNGNQIELHLNHALEVIKNFDKNYFDLIFIDADKQNYLNYYRQGYYLLRPGGIMIIDNMLWHDEVLQPKSLSAKTIDLLNQTITKDTRVQNLFLGTRDGLQIIRKL